MSDLPSAEALRDALDDAGFAHHEYEEDYLEGVRDEQWAGWYAAFVIGRLGEFVPASDLARLLADAPDDADDWPEAAADHVRESLEG